MGWPIKAGHPLSPASVAAYFFLEKITYNCSKMVRQYLAVCILVLIVMTFTEAAYKKPPFNGSIFGKRGNTIVEYENAGKAFSSLCEIASEACAAWFPMPDN